MRSSINCVHTMHFYAPKTWICQRVIPERERNFISSSLACMGSMFCLHPCTRTRRSCVRRSCTNPQTARCHGPLVSDAMLRRVWTRLRHRLSSLDSSTSMVEVSTAYVTHVIDMYINKHRGNHMTGDSARILLPTLPFLLRDFIASEVQPITPPLAFSPQQCQHTIGYNV